MAGIYSLIVIIFISTLHLENAYNPRHNMYLPHLMGDMKSCLTKLSSASCYKCSMKLLVVCMRTRVSFCLSSRGYSLTDKQLHRLINLPRYCGFYVSDIRDSNINIQVYILRGYNVLLDILYFNLQWSKSTCSDQGVRFGTNTETDSVFCGKRLPWQYKHIQNRLLIRIYGLSAHTFPVYFNFFYGIHVQRAWQQCCKRAFMPASLIPRKSEESNLFYIIADLKYQISVATSGSNVFLIFDGPGTKSPFFQLTSNLSRQSSSSHIVISTLNTSHLSGRVMITYIDQFNIGVLRQHDCFHYIARKAMKYTQINIEFRNNKSNHICHYMFLGSNYIFYRPYVNISRFTFDGPTVHTEALNSSCQYGGIYFHTIDRNGDFKLRREMCGNIGQKIPQIVSYPEKDLLLSIVWYRGYSSGQFMAELHLLACSIIALPCSLYSRKTVSLSTMSSCNMFYFIWLDDETKRHHCQFTMFSYNSRIIGPAQLSISTNSKSDTVQRAPADIYVFMRSYNDWPHCTSVNNHYLRLRSNSSKHLTRDIKYLDTAIVGYSGTVQSDRLIKLTVNVSGCHIKEHNEMAFVVQSSVIVDILCSSSNYKDKSII